MTRRTLLLLLSVALLSSTAAFASQAGLVIDLGNGNVTTQCVTFSGPVTTAFDLLQLSGATFTFDDSFHFGAAICSIGSVGCSFPQETCFCQCPSTSGSCLFYSLLLLRNGAWVVAEVGPSHFVVRNGSVIAFSFGDGSTTPPVFTFEQICG
jgi:hypothetical protein